MSKEKMISFNGDMVRAILDGSKTQTRRPCRVQPPAGDWLVNVIIGDAERNGECCFVEPGTVLMVEGCNRTKWFKPSLQPGDTMLVRERARLIMLNYGDTVDMGIFEYEADHKNSGFVRIPKRLKPIKIGNCVPNGCFKELVRPELKRKVVRVWYEQWQDISDADILAEGVRKHHISDEYGVKVGDKWLWFEKPIKAYEVLINSIYHGSWDRNDWVECIEFEGASKCE